VKESDSAPPKPEGLIANSGWNLVAFASSLAAQFVTIPFVVRWIGLESLGIASVIIAVCAPLSLVGIVTGQALIREISSRITAETVVRDYTTAAIRCCLFGSFAGSVALLALAPTICQHLIRTKVDLTSLQLAVLIAVIGSIAQQVGIVLQSVTAAIQNYSCIARFALITSIATASSTIGFSNLYPDFFGYLLGVSVGFLLTTLFWLRKWWPAISWRSVVSIQNPPEMKALLHFSKWQSIAQFAGIMGNQIDRYVLGVMTPITIVGQYTVANRLQEAAYIGVMKSGEVLFPRFGSMENHNIESKWGFFRTASWAVGTFSAATLVPLAVLSTSVLSLWVGPQVGGDASWILFVLVLGGIVGSASNVFVFYAMAMGRNTSVASISVVFAITTVIMTIILIYLFGALAAGMGLLIASIVRVAMSMTLTKQLFFPSVPWSQLWMSTVSPALVGTLFASLGHFLPGMQTKSYVELIIRYGAISFVVTICCFAAISLTRDGRSMLLRLSNSALAFRS
jgi:O-antigen/teichoic acid export membrane protein